MMTFGLLPTLSVALLGHKYANILFPAEYNQGGLKQPYFWTFGKKLKPKKPQNSSKIPQKLLRGVGDIVKNPR